MGSFAYTCAVSGLPIEAGDKVFYLMLTQNPYHEEGKNVCYSTDVWFPRTPPLAAHYNDYGSVENIGRGVVRKLWLKGLQLDLIEQGVGDNSAHDVPTSKAMTFDELLDALQEGRVLVDRNFAPPPRSSREIDALLARVDPDFALSWRQCESISHIDTTPQGIPTLQRITHILTSHGHDVAQGFDQHGFFVDELMHGYVRIRCAGNYDSKIDDSVVLSHVVSLFKDEYEAVVVAGGGSSPNSADLLVLPYPNAKGFYGYLEKRHKDPLVVSHAMIRRDVWEALLSSEQCQKELHSLLERGADHIVDIFRKFSLPCVGIGTHLDLLIQEGTTIPKSLIKILAEFAVIETRLDQCRYQWRPSSSVGPQFGEWRAHAELFKVFQRVARTNARKRDTDCDV